MSTRLMDDRKARAMALRGLRKVLTLLREQATDPPAVATYPETVSWNTPATSTPEKDLPEVAAAFRSHGAPIVMPQGTTVSPAGPNPGMRQLLERLVYLLGLSDLEREFFAAGAAREVPDAWDGLSAYADWLEDRGNEAGAARVRKLTPQPGDVLVHYVPPSTSTQEELESHVAPARALAEALAARGVETVLAVLPPGGSLGRLSEEQMAAAGWVRAERLAEEREACATLCENVLRGAAPENVAAVIRARGCDPA